jgi:hypothetical protein
MQKTPMAMKWQSMITKKTSDERASICHPKSTSDGSALGMICEGDEEPRSSLAARQKIAMVCTCYKAMDTFC